MERVRVVRAVPGVHPRYLVLVYSKRGWHVVAEAERWQDAHRVKNYIVALMREIAPCS
jgi:hypothetical protein